MRLSNWESYIRGVGSCLLSAIMACVVIVAYAQMSWAEEGEERDSITPTRIKAHMRFLADDLLLGRETGAVGYDIAANYVASQFAQLGLAPAGDAEKSYFQQVPLRQFTVQPQATQLSFLGETPVELQLWNDYLVLGNVAYHQREAVAPIVFVGNGIYDPQQDIDDYAGQDVRGKYVAFLDRAPQSLDPDVRAHYLESKAEMAAAKGALGAFLLMTPENLKVFTYELWRNKASKPRTAWIQPDGKIHNRATGLKSLIYLPPATSTRLFEGETHSFTEILEASRQGQPIDSFALSKRADLKVRLSPGKLFHSPNVVGLLEGSDESLKHEYIVVSAHLDHLGVDLSHGENGIYNGLLDNASGVAVMLEIAAKMASEPAPARSVVFLALTAEEKGHLGADYFSKYPTVPRSGVVANINFDMPFLFFPVTGVIAFGAQHSNMRASVDEAMATLGLSQAPDPVPQMAVFTKSDQYQFALEGIPAMTLQPAFGQEGKSDAKTGKVFHFLETDYHQPSDSYSGLDVDYQAGADFARAGHAVAFAVANSSASPSWKKGGFFSLLKPGPQRVQQD